MDADYTDDEPTAVVLPFKKPEPRAKPEPSRSSIDRTTHRLFSTYGLLDRCNCFDCRLDKMLNRGRFAPKRPSGRGA